MNKYLKKHKIIILQICYIKAGKILILELFQVKKNLLFIMKKLRKDSNPASFDIEQYKALDFSEIINELPDQRWQVFKSRPT